MKLLFSSLGLLSAGFFAAQTADTVKTSTEIESVTLIARKPTVESKADRTVFNVANSSILAGNTTWDIVRMTPLVSIDNNDNVKAEGESVTVYINDRKSVFTGKELKEYLKTIPADNLMKIEVITSPSSRYEATGSVINIVLKKRDDEGLKGSISLTNTQNTKNNQYGSLNLNYHKKNFTQTFTGSYSDNVFISKNSGDYSYYETKIRQLINFEAAYTNRNPSFSSTSEFELNDKNNVGLVVEYFNGKRGSDSDSFTRDYNDGNFVKLDYQNLNSSTTNNVLGTNLFYKYYDKEKNKILDINLGVNYDSDKGNTDRFLKSKNESPVLDWSNVPASEQTAINNNNQNRNYFLKVDFTTPLGKNGGNLEVGGKANFNNNVIPNTYLDLINVNKSVNSDFHYVENINSLYFNYSKTFFEKLETRIGLRYEYIKYKIRENVSGKARDDSYGTFLPNLLVKYSFSPNYDLSLTYNHNLWRPWYSEFNPFEMPSNNGIYSRGNIDLLPNPSDRVALKFGIHKKYFISARYMFTDQDYWDNYAVENGRTVLFQDNFKGKVEKLYVFANTNQNLFKNKLNVNFGLGWYYIDNSDFNARNILSRENNYINFVSGSANLSYTNLFNKNINLSAWMSVDNQNNGNSVANQYNYFHNLTVTKIFPVSQIETSVQFMNIFKRPSMNSTTYSQIGAFQNYNIWDWYGVSLTFVKRFGNQKVKENTKTDVEKNSGGGK
ncbi:MAG: TonB-dependent receptor [Chryseobacterium sp.]|nr:MAG: TonB-dependent receptor [Chryseobacterium sp.]